MYWITYQRFYILTRIGQVGKKTWQDTNKNTIYRVYQKAQFPVLCASQHSLWYKFRRIGKDTLQSGPNDSRLIVTPIPRKKETNNSLLWPEKKLRSRINRMVCHFHIHKHPWNDCPRRYVSQLSEIRRNKSNVRYSRDTKAWTYA